MADKFNALLQNDTWSLVLVSTSMTVVNCNWVLEIKRHSDGSIE